MCIEVNIDQTKNNGAFIYRQNYFSATHNNLVESTDQTLTFYRWPPEGRSSLSYTHSSYGFAVLYFCNFQLILRTTVRIINILYNLEISVV